MINRRRFLKGIFAYTAMLAPAVAFARAETDRRLVVIVLRGAMDGLHVVVPYADPGYAVARRQLALAVGADGGAIKLDGTFGLHASLEHTAQLFAKGKALFVHAVASPYRGRSHVDGQNVLEIGGTHPYQHADGWLNRLLPLLPDGQAIALAPTVPLLLRGSFNVGSYVPAYDDDVTADLLERVGQMYADDEFLSTLWNEAMATRGMAGSQRGGDRNLVELAGLAGGFLSKPDGPRIAVLESYGWDTHTNQRVRLDRRLSKLDKAVAVLEKGLGPNWENTVVIALTEFGRTVATNGTGGTDHGTASAAIMAGGAIRGGRILADWPGLQPSALLEERDLRPTTDMHALLRDLLAELFGLDAARVARQVFPGVRDENPSLELIRT